MDGIWNVVILNDLHWPITQFQGHDIFEVEYQKQQVLEKKVVTIYDTDIKRNLLTLKPGLGVTEGHWKWHHLIHLWLPIDKDYCRRDRHRSKMYR